MRHFFIHSMYFSECIIQSMIIRKMLDLFIYTHTRVCAYIYIAIYVSGCTDFFLCIRIQVFWDVMLCYWDSGAEHSEGL
jgi:hypothetical protein